MKGQTCVACAHTCVACAHTCVACAHTCVISAKSFLVCARLPASCLPRASSRLHRKSFLVCARIPASCLPRASSRLHRKRFLGDLAARNESSLHGRIRVTPALLKNGRSPIIGDRPFFNKAGVTRILPCSELSLRAARSPRKLFLCRREEALGRHDAGIRAQTRKLFLCRREEALGKHDAGSRAQTRKLFADMTQVYAQATQVCAQATQVCAQATQDSLQVMDEIQLVLITLNPDGTDTKLGHMVLVLQVYKTDWSGDMEGTRHGTARNEKTSRPYICVGDQDRESYRLPGMERLSLGIQDLFAAGVSQAPRPKDPLAPGEKCGVIYKIKCEECGEVYVDQESRNPHRKMKEAVHIQLEGAKLNRTECWELPKTYPYSGGRQRGVGPDRPMQVSGLVSRSREIRPLREQDGLIAIENLEPLESKVVLDPLVLYHESHDPRG
ncbi:hypothetical protein Bbelb_377740 [Branchiostoma belcheri]|nr:hypothetical protein Bbelb_377740 [Branchiostoma belcheri]